MKASWKEINITSYLLIKVINSINIEVIIQEAVSKIISCKNILIKKVKSKTI